MTYPSMHDHAATLYQNFRTNQGRFNRRLLEELHRLWGVEYTRHLFPRLLNTYIMSDYQSLAGKGAFIAFDFDPRPAHLSVPDLPNVSSGYCRETGVRCYLSNGALTVDPYRRPTVPAPAFLHPNLTYEVLMGDESLVLGDVRFIAALDRAVDRAILAQESST